MMRHNDRLLLDVSGSVSMLLLNAISANDFSGETRILFASKTLLLYSTLTLRLKFILLYLSRYIALMPSLFGILLRAEPNLPGGEH